MYFVYCFSYLKFKFRNRRSWPDYATPRYRLQKSGDWILMHFEVSTMLLRFLVSHKTPGSLLPLTHLKSTNGFVLPMLIQTDP